MARLRCATVSGLQTFVLGFLCGIFFLLWFRDERLDLSRVPAKCPELKCPEIPALPDTTKSCQCPVCTPCDVERVKLPAVAAAAGGGPGYLAATVDRAFYTPIIKQLVELGPPSASCLPDLNVANDGAFFPPRTRKFDMVLVLAQGRSGSTSLMRLLNTIPCYNIRGENLFLFAKLIGYGKGGPLTADTFREALMKLQRDVVFPWNVTRYEEPKLPKKPSYFNRFDFSRLDQLAKLSIGEFLQHVPGYLTSGFKELRLFNLNAYHYNVSVNFLDQWMTLFPRTAVIFCHREKDILNSAWWKEGDKEWTKKLLTTQSEWFHQFHAEIKSGTRYGPQGSVVQSDGIDSAMVEFDDLLSCNDAPGSGLRKLFDMLGEQMDVERCKALMENNVEDMGLAASESNYNGEPVGYLAAVCVSREVTDDRGVVCFQGFKNWYYGYRTLTGGKLSPFTILNLTRPIPDYPSEKEFYGPETSGANYIIRRNYQRPVIPDPKQDLAYVPCRAWFPDTESANVKITVNLHSVPGSCNPKAGLTVKLIKDGRDAVLEKPIALLKENEAQPGLEFSVITPMPRGTVFELCVEPRGVVCEGVGIRMTVNRHGPSRQKSESG